MPAVILDIHTGDTFGPFTVISDVYTPRKGWFVKCTCGTESYRTLDALKKNKSCGPGCALFRKDSAYHHQAPKTTYTLGQRIGKWEVISPEPVREDGRFRWKVRCECGVEDTIILVGLKGLGCPICTKKAKGERTRKFIERKQRRLRKSEFNALFPHRFDMKNKKCLCGKDWPHGRAK